MLKLSKEELAEIKRQRYANKKAAFFKDKSCGMCGSLEDLEIDHYDPEEKSFNINWHLSRKKLEPELEKCWALCRNCHRKKTNAEMKHKVPKHGTLTMYQNYHCRCDPCKKAKKKYRQKLKEGRSIGSGPTPSF